MPALRPGRLHDDPLAALAVCAHRVGRAALEEKKRTAEAVRVGAVRVGEEEVARAEVRSPPHVAHGARTTRVGRRVQAGRRSRRLRRGARGDTRRTARCRSAPRTRRARAGEMFARRKARSLIVPLWAKTQRPLWNGCVFSSDEQPTVRCRMCATRSSPRLHARARGSARPRARRRSPCRRARRGRRPRRRGPSRRGARARERRGCAAPPAGRGETRSAQTRRSQEAAHRAKRHSNPVTPDGDFRAYASEPRAHARARDFVTFSPCSNRTSRLTGRRFATR